MSDFRKIIYMKKKNIDLSQYEASKDALSTIETAGLEENLVLRLKINSPVFIEAAAPLTKEGIETITSQK